MFFLLGIGCVPGIGVANVCLALCLASALAWRWQARKAGEDFLGPFRRTTPVHGPIAAFVLLSVVSCFFSTLPSKSLLQVKGFGTFLLVVFAAALLDDEADVKLAVDVWRTTALYLVLRGFAEWISGSPSLDFRIAGGLSVYMTYAGLLLVFVPLLGARGVSGGSSRARWADVAVALAGAVAMALTLTRGAYLGPRRRRRRASSSRRGRASRSLAPFAIALFFVLMPLPVRDRLASATNPRDVTMNDRVAMWKAGRAMIADHPLTGVGPGRVKPLYPSYRVPGFVNPIPGHLHNNLVMIAAETGIPSLLAYLAFVGAFFLGALRILRRTPRGDPARGVTLGAIGAMAALFAAGMFEYNFGDVEVLMATLVVATLPFAAARAAARRRLESADVEPLSRARLSPQGRSAAPRRRDAALARGRGAGRDGDDGVAAGRARSTACLKGGIPERVGAGRGLGLPGAGRLRALFFSLKDESGGATLRVMVFASDDRRHSLRHSKKVFSSWSADTPDVYPERGKLSLRHRRRSSPPASARSSSRSSSSRRGSRPRASSTLRRSARSRSCRGASAS